MLPRCRELAAVSRHHAGPGCWRHAGERRRDAGGTPVSTAGMLAIRAGHLFDGVSAALVEQPVVLVQAGRIVAVGSGGAAPAEAEVVDLGSATLLPGLVDAHLHLAFDASPDPVGRLDTVDDDQLLDGMRAAARTALAAGITTVRDLGDRGYLALRLRDELAGSPAAGPQVLAAGPPITTTRGHCWFLGGQAEGVEGVRAAVREHADRGVDVIKVMATGGELTPGTHSHRAQYGLAELRAAVEEAHRHGLPIAAHAHAGVGIANAVAAGVDTVEHCSFLTEDSARVDPEVLDALVRAGVVVSLTLGFLPRFTPPPRIAGLLPYLTVAARLVRASGATIVCSSDAGIGPPKPHDVLPYGAAAMIEMAGSSPVEALRSVTSVAAEACRVGDRKGRLATGFDADILAVKGDPLADITALRDVAAVFRAGERVR
jgi:imidazolonepropionase-like amidohydrolase